MSQPADMTDHRHDGYGEVALTTLTEVAERIGMPSSTVFRLRAMEEQVTVGQCLSSRRSATERLSRVFGIGRAKIATLMEGVERLAADAGASIEDRAA